MESGIYSITNTKNSKIYIGSTNNFKRRKRQHFRDLKQNKHDNPHLQASYNKYGKEFFKFDIVEYVENLIERELFYIEKYNSVNNNYGYNINLPKKSDVISSRLSIKTFVLDTVSQEVNEFDSREKVAIHFDILPRVVSNYISVNKLFKRRYLFLNEYPSVEYINNKSKTYYNIYSINKNELIQFDTLTKCANYFNTDITHLNNVLKRDFPIYKNTYFILEKDYNSKINYVEILQNFIAGKKERKKRKESYKPRVIKKLYATNLSNNETVGYESLNKFIELNPEFKYKGIEKVLYGERNHYKGFSFSR